MLVTKLQIVGSFIEHFSKLYFHGSIKFPQTSITVAGIFDLQFSRLCRITITN